MSIDEVGSESTFGPNSPADALLKVAKKGGISPIDSDRSDGISKRKGTRSRPAKVRKHKLTTAYKQDLATQLDKLHAAGEDVLIVLASPDIRGFEIVSYTEE